MSISFDPLKNALVYAGKKSSRLFWENSWLTSDIKRDILARHFDTLVTPITKKFLKPEAKVLEGGCGKGEYVYLLKKNGFNSFGIDITNKTIKKIKLAFPNLNVYCQDARHLNFKDNYFDGYWSLGVIEHFYNGFEPIISEAYRVIKNGGHLFVTFPYISPLRQLKIRLKMYKMETKKPSGFYQFALNKNIVTEKIESYGFKKVFEKPLDGFKGFKDEVKNLRFIFEPINNLSKINPIFGGIRLILANILAPFSGHTILLVFIK